MHRVYIGYTSGKHQVYIRPGVGVGVGATHQHGVVAGSGIHRVYIGIHRVYIGIHQAGVLESTQSVVEQTQTVAESNVGAY